MSGNHALKGKIHSIETFGTVDGPGVRFVVFFQGCPMRCLYCHNPDTWDISCAEGEYTADELIEQMIRNLPFYSSGGITASGGEPLLQIDFLTELFRLAKSHGIHTCLDTSGITFTPENTVKFDTLLDVTDLVMLDIKHIDDAAHVCLTKRSNSTTLAFARYLRERGVAMRIRYVLVPGYTDSREALEGLGKFLRGFDNLEKLEVLPYHVLGKAKYENLGIAYPIPDVPPATEDEARRAHELITLAMTR